MGHDEGRASQIIRRAVLAPYGRGKDTIVDTRVRKVWQLGPNEVRLSGKHWADTFAAMLARVSEGLGAPKDAVTATDYTREVAAAAKILSVGTRRTDEITKRKLYERFGVQECWVVDPELDVIKVYRRSAGRFGKVAELSAEQQKVLTTPLLPDWSIALSEAFVSPV